MGGGRGGPYHGFTEEFCAIHGFMEEISSSRRKWSVRLLRTETLIITRFNRFEHTDWTDIKCDPFWNFLFEKKKKTSWKWWKKKKENSVKDQNSQIRRQIEAHSEIPNFNTPSHGPRKSAPRKKTYVHRKAEMVFIDLILMQLFIYFAKW